MSKILATIKDIKTVDSLNIVTFDFFGNELKMMSLELGNSVQVGIKVLLGVKPTSIAIAKSFNGEISFSNKLSGKIISVDNGELLCNVKLAIANTTFESIITIDSAKKMELQIGDEVSALIKASELSIVEVYDA